MKEKIRFGTAGNPEAFYTAGHKSSVEMPRFLAAQGLDAYEYQCSRGVRISQQLAEKIGDEAVQHNVALSIHAPYYINLASNDPTILASSKEHLLKSIQAAIWMGATTVVFHSGGVAKVVRETALEQAKTILLEVLATSYDRLGPHQVCLAPETMGKKNQLGNLEEVVELCSGVPQLRPAIDFGHLNALYQGQLDNREAMGKVLDQLAQKLGQQTVQNFHSHFSPIEFTAAGEKKHWTLLNPEYGPDFANLAYHLALRKLTPTIICESAGRQSEDAVAYLRSYQDFLENSTKILPDVSI